MSTGRPRGRPRAKQPPTVIQARYDAAGIGRRMRGWTPASSGPNRAIEGLQRIRDRARDVARNDWSGESALTKWTTNLIGVGITPRFASTAVKDAWKAWVPMADADGALDFYGMQTLATRSWFDSGEVFARFRYRRPEFGMPVPLQVQLIEAEFVPILDADSWPGLPPNNHIRSGIERNRSGQRTAYWVYKQHPGDDKGNAIDPSRLVRVPADEMVHLYLPKRPGQLRGVSLLAPVLARLRGVADFDDAVLERQKLSNLFTMFVTRPMPPNVADLDFDPDTGLPTFYDNDGQPVAGLQPGMSQELLPGEDVKFANPPEAGTTFSDYMRTQHLGTSAGAGLPYELFSGDIKEVSDRTLRVVINEFRRLAEQHQWQVLIPRFCQKVMNEWALVAGQVGAISLTDVQVALNAQWQPHGWAYIHPVQDVQGKQMEVDAGFRSRSSVISERGDDPTEVDEERKGDLGREKEMGLYVEPPAEAGQGGDTDGIDNSEYSAPPNAMLAAVNARIDNLLARDPLPQPAPSFVINNHLPQTQVTNEVNPTPVNVAAPEVKVEVAPPAVNVGAPVVTVEAPVVNVAAPNVDVHNEVQPAEVRVELPDRKIVSEIERDREGNIKNVTQTETTIQPTLQ